MVLDLLRVKIVALVYSILTVKYEVKEEMRGCRKLVSGTYLVLALLSRVAEVSDIGVLRKRSQPHLWQGSSGDCRARRTGDHISTCSILISDYD